MFVIQYMDVGVSGPCYLKETKLSMIVKSAVCSSMEDGRSTEPVAIRFAIQMLALCVSVLKCVNSAWGLGAQTTLAFLAISASALQIGSLIKKDAIAENSLVKGRGVMDPNASPAP
jgi:hypothetical protein